MFNRKPARTDDLALDLLVEEYKSLRAEVHFALSYAQGIVRWTVAIYGAVLAAALVAADHAEAGAGYSFLSTSLLLLFGFALPGISWVAAWTWLGELMRMERAGAYLRGLELQVRELGANSLGFAPLRWETYIHAQKAAGARTGKSRAAYLGTAAMFFGSTALSTALFIVWWGTMFSWDWTGTLWLWLLAGVVFEVALCGGTFLLYRQLSALGRDIGAIPR